MGTPDRSSIQLKMLVMAAVLTIAAAAVPARASLGGDAASIQADQIHLQGRRTMRTAGSYTVHEIQGPGGTVVREYISTGGMVFGVAWQGPWVPDMRQLLGSYFDQFARANQAQAQANQAQNGARMRRRPVLIDVPGLVVQIGGHPRAFAGRAYVPEMLPSGVGAENIQ